MRKSLAAAIVVALAVASCGGSATVTTSSTTFAGETTTTSGAGPDAQVLSYNLEAGNEFSYEVEMTQTIEMTGEGSGAALTGEEIPDSANIEMTAKGTFNYSVADGPDEGTYAVTITGEFTEVTATGLVDGQPVDESEVPEFAEVAPVDVTIIVDEQGNIVPDSSGLDDPMAGLFGGLEDLGGIPSSNPGQFFGPPFGDDMVSVGSNWESTYTTPGLGEDPITTTTRASVTGTDVVDGVELLVIEAETEVSPIEFDLGDFFIGLFTGFLPDDPTPEEQAEIDALIEGLRFVISMDTTHSTSTTLFDPVSGVTHSFRVLNASKVGMDVNFPDEETGELSGFVMNMSIEQDISQVLVSGPES